MPERFPGDIHPAFAEVLRSDREALNQRFRLRQRGGAKIDESAFHLHLKTTVNDLVDKVALANAERVRATANGLFDVSLDLFAAGLLGHQTKHPHIVAAWRDVLPQAITLLARDPVRVAGCLSNAVDHLAAHGRGRPGEWIEIMARLTPACHSIPQWLDVGIVAAWRAGLVQYRSAALRVARELPWTLSASCLGTGNGPSEADWRAQLERLDADRWYRPQPEPTAAISRSLRIVRMTGGFRGFGGPCLRPPTVRSQAEGLFVSDGVGAWQLLADAFGTYWRRISEFPRTSKVSAAPHNVSLDAAGQVTWVSEHRSFAELAEASSYACDGQTLAVTLPTSHHVFLVARAPTELK